jgi:hypothetical protein
MSIDDRKFAGLLMSTRRSHVCGPSVQREAADEDVLMSAHRLTLGLAAAP